MTSTAYRLGIERDEDDEQTFSRYVVTNEAGTVEETFEIGGWSDTNNQAPVDRWLLGLGYIRAEAFDRYPDGPYSVAVLHLLDEDDVNDAVLREVEAVLLDKGHDEAVKLARQRVAS